MADVPGWPFFSPPRVQMQKCEKCSREYFSTINYRRHMLLHRRNLNIDKDSTTKNRGLLQAFWDKLSVEESIEILSCNDLSLAGDSGTSIIGELTSLVLKPRSISLPLSYVKAGAAVLDIVQARPSKFPISSSDLFSVLDDASENTFLCAGPAGSLQKFVFNGDAGKIGLEMRNLVACASFLIEQNMVKAFLADKNAEALRHQKLLVEEEEAAQRRQAALLEKKRLKKLRRKEQKAKELPSVETDESSEDNSPTLPITSPLDVPNCNPEILEMPHSPTSSPDPVQTMSPKDKDRDHEDRYPHSSMCQNVEHGTLHQNGRRSVANSHWQAPRMQRSSNSFHGNHQYQVVKSGTTQKHVSYRDFHSSIAANVSQVWAPKSKSETDKERYSSRTKSQEENLPIEDTKSEVLIGSISVTLVDFRRKQNDESFCRASEGCGLELPAPVENGIHGKSDKNEVFKRIANGSTVKLWRPVSRHGNGSHLPTQNCDEAPTVGAVPCDDNNELHLQCEADSNSTGCGYYANPSMENGHEGCLRFSSHVAEAFLAKRWKEAISSSDHVKLVLFPQSKSPKALNDNQAAIPSSKLDPLCLDSSRDNRLATLESLPVTKLKIGPNLEKGNKVKYIPKQRSVT